MNTVVLLLGSNMGDKKNNLSIAINTINQTVGKVLKESEILETLPEGYESKNNYLNQGVIIRTSLSPIQLLNSIKLIENKLGRTKDSALSGKYEDRPIDIDIIYFNSITYYSNRLTIPHLAHTLKRKFSQKILRQLS